MSLLSSIYKKRDSTKQAGFTLIELIVSIGIMLVIISTVAMSQSGYSSGAALKNAANDISLSLRQAQVYGISVREFSTGTADFSAAFGIDFRLPGASGANNAYILFGDLGAHNGVYDSSWTCPVGGTSECIQKVSLAGDNTVSALCVVWLNDTEDCTLGRVDVTFLRPSTDAKLAIFNVSGQSVSSANAKGVKIKLVSPKSETRSVTVYTTGQISVQ